MVVSTLDGKVSALDVQDSGKILWSVDADTRPLLSSSIGNLEVGTSQNSLKNMLECGIKLQCNLPNPTPEYFNILL